MTDRPRKRAKTRRDAILLREMDRGPDYFWRTAIPQRAQHNINDCNLDATFRKLPGNEVVVMGLNELARHYGSGWFMYLPSRGTWRAPRQEPMIPVGRVPEPPGAEYPTILYMNFKHDNTTQAAFDAESQRGRYLKCNALINPPSELTPLYAIQFNDSAVSQLYITQKPSLALIMNASHFFLASTIDLERIVGRWGSGKAKRPTGADPHLRLDTMPYLYDQDKLAAGTRSKFEQLQGYRYDGIEQVYHAIIRLCNRGTGSIPVTMNVNMLRGVVPRGNSPYGGMSLGTPLVPQLPRRSLGRQRTPRDTPEVLTGGEDGFTDDAFFDDDDEEQLSLGEFDSHS